VVGRAEGIGVTTHAPIRIKLSSSGAWESFFVTVQGGKMMVGGGFSSLPPQGERFGVR
jgi:hypothetical protein